MSDHPGCGAVTYAESNGLRVFNYAPHEGADPKIHEDLLKELQSADVNLVVLAGFVKVRSVLHL